MILYEFKHFKQNEMGISVRFMFPKIQLIKNLLEINYNPSSHKYDMIDQTINMSFLIMENQSNSAIKPRLHQIFLSI